MKELRFEYRMSLSFTEPIAKHRFTLRCIPRSNERQEISDLDVEVSPKEFLASYDDSFGNRCIYGYAEAQHNRFLAKITGTARTGLAAWEPAKEEHLIGMYRYHTDYTAPGPSIRAFSNQFYFSPDESAYNIAVAYMHGLYERFRYVQGATGIHTTAEQAFSRGKGVCQDYSHILLSLCRIRRIPSRYVVGMLVGEGMSHAWVEICDSGRWIALDPTNNLIVDDQHIRISTGRDYKDCTINQGLFTGRTRQSQDICVSVSEIGGEIGGTL